MKPMKQNPWESIRLMLWAWELGQGGSLPQGLREVLEKAEELLEGAAEADAPTGGGEAPTGGGEAPAKKALDRKPQTKAAEEPDPLAARLLDYMKSRELNASRVAVDLGVKPTTLRDILCGRRQPREKTLEAIRGYLAARGQEAPGAE